MYIRRILQNETGQMAVFVALIFQVLFVLFAMVINIGLIVHDKINLQNSVDLAAYYAAERQAEAMNMIAHINYQMRQDYKLLSWRYRVLGAFGVDEPQKHPAIDSSGSLNDVSFNVEPSICIAHQGWAESFTKDASGNKCKYTNLTIPDLKSIKMIPLAPGFNASVISQFERAKDTIKKSCQNISPYNWGFATIITAAFRMSTTERKKEILKLAQNLSSKDDMLDVRGESIRAGALKTLKYNLTASNKAPGSFDEQDPKDFEFINGLAQGGCDSPDAIGFPSWLVDIPISPIVRYTELKTEGGSSSQCSATVRSYDTPPSGDTINLMDPNGTLRKLAGEPEGKSIEHSSRGFEKNPWCLAYIAIKAKTKPRKPFAPFGAPIQMEAKAIAEPFGGRIGPWNGKRWPAQALESDNSDQTDPLAVPRGDFDSKYGSLYLPNYSRYPGDRYGLKSRMALGWMRDTLAMAFSSQAENLKMKYGDYGDIINSIVRQGDPLAYNTQTNNPGNSRRLELAAVAPDLFDMAYYSIDPQYNKDFYIRAKDKLFQGIAPIADLGMRADNADMSNILSVSVHIKSAQEHTDYKDVYYLAKDWKNLLTGWIQSGAVDYSANSQTISENFGDCKVAPDENKRQPAIPGNCIAGGRVGYSVRLVHKDYLQGEHELGGEGAGKDRIKNALPGDF